MKYSFDVGPEGWCSYDYHGCVRAGRNIFILAVWQRSGGVDDGGYIWSDEHGWSADTPENPISVFPFTLKRNWIGGGPIDLRNAEVSVYLRGDGLQLHGGQCYFHILSNGTSWHYNSHPLEIGDGRWPSRPNRFILKDDESLWHRAWASDPSKARSVGEVLAECTSFAVKLAGFTSVPSGKIAMDELEIKLA